MGLIYQIKAVLVKCSIQRSRNHLFIMIVGISAKLWICILTQNTTGKFGNHGEILGKYAILGEKSMGSKGLFGYSKQIQSLPSTCYKLLLT